MATADEIKAFEMVADHERRIRALEKALADMAADEKPKKKVEEMEDDLPW